MSMPVIATHRTQFPHDIEAKETIYDSGLVEIALRFTAAAPLIAPVVLISRQPQQRRTGGWCLYYPNYSRPVVFTGKTEAMMAAQAYLRGYREGNATAAAAAAAHVSTPRVEA